MPPSLYTEVLLVLGAATYHTFEPQCAGWDCRIPCTCSRHVQSSSSAKSRNHSKSKPQATKNAIKVQQQSGTEAPAPAPASSTSSTSRDQGRVQQPDRVLNACCGDNGHQTSRFTHHGARASQIQKLRVAQLELVAISGNASERQSPRQMKCELLEYYPSVASADA
eukprot:6181046-Pleurochrysis_carterae.AAC.3